MFFSLTTMELCKDDLHQKTLIKQFFRQPQEIQRSISTHDISRYQLPHNIYKNVLLREVAQYTYGSRDNKFPRTLYNLDVIVSKKLLRWYQ